MSSPDAVRERLEAALAKLETAIDEHVRTDGEKLRQLSQQLDKAKQENARLQQLTDTIAGRLEATIARLKTVLNN